MREATEHNSGGGSADPSGPSFAATGLELAEQLSSIDPDSLTDGALVDYVAATKRLASWVESKTNDGLVALARRPQPAVEVDAPEVTDAHYALPGQIVRDYLDDELAAALRTSSRGASRQIELACGLVRLPETQAALRDGRIDVARVRAMFEETEHLTEPEASVIDADYIVRAERWTPARLRKALKRAVLEVDPAEAQARHERAKADRYVAVTPGEDGMAELYARLPAPEAIAVRAALTAAAKAQKAVPEETRSLDQLRADTLCEVFVEGLVAGELRGRRLSRTNGEVCELQVTVAATTLLDQDDSPGHLRGYGSITADLVRDLEPTSRMRRLLIDPVEAKVLDIGRTSYKPTADISRHVHAAHPRCTFPTCNRPANQSELDHVIPFPEGPTSVDNLRPRCKRHHLLKHAPGFGVEELPDGTTRWRFPSGHTHENDPEPPLPTPKLADERPPDPVPEPEPEPPPDDQPPPF